MGALVRSGHAPPAGPATARQAASQLSERGLALFSADAPQGDLSHRIEIPGRDELSEIDDLVERMNLRLSAMVAEIRSSAVRVGMSGQQVSHSSQSPADRTDVQASNLRQTVATVGQPSKAALRCAIRWQRWPGCRAAHFLDRDLYVFVIDHNGRYRVHGAKPAMQGKRVHEVPGIDGDSFLRDAWTAAPTGGWVAYDIVNPSRAWRSPRRPTSGPSTGNGRWVAGCTAWRPTSLADQSRSATASGGRPPLAGSACPAAADGWAGACSPPAGAGTPCQPRTR